MLGFAGLDRLTEHKNMGGWWSVLQFSSSCALSCWYSSFSRKYFFEEHRIIDCCCGPCFEYYCLNSPLRLLHTEFWFFGRRRDFKIAEGDTPAQYYSSRQLIFILLLPIFLVHYFRVVTTTGTSYSISIVIWWGFFSFWRKGPACCLILLIPREIL